MHPLFNDNVKRFSIHVLLQQLLMLFFLEFSSNISPLIVNECKNVISSRQMTYLINFYTLWHRCGFLFINILWRKLHNEELSDLYFLSKNVRVVKSRRMRWAVHVARMGEGRGVHRVLVGKPEGKRPLGRPRRRWKDNIKMYLQETGGGCGDWMELAPDRDRWRALVSTVMNLRVPWNAGNFLTSCRTS